LVIVIIVIRFAALVIVIIVIKFAYFTFMY
jgi:hypothetical protein